jgi:hypothetical protein
MLYRGALINEQFKEYLWISAILKLLFFIGGILIGVTLR